MRDYNSKELYPNTKTLSSSQFLDYLKDPFEFHLKWVLGVNGKEGPALKFGKIFSEAYADRSYDYHKELSEDQANIITRALPFLPELPKKFCEYPLRPKFKGWTIRITLDGFEPEKYQIIENKTGAEGNGWVVGWTQERVNSSDQLTLQSWGFWKIKGVPPTRTILNFIPTSKNPKSPVQIFRTTRSIKYLKLFERKVEAVIENIEAGNFTRKLY